MSFQYLIVLSPWANEVLYRRALEGGEPNVKRFLLGLWLEAVENQQTVAKAISIATRQAEQVHGKAHTRRTRASQNKRVRRH